MNLAQFIKTNMEQLLEDWEEAVIEIAPELKDHGSIVLRDHAREMLEFVISDIGTHQTTKESASKALGTGKLPISDVGNKHGKERQSQGLTILQMVQELRALRARVTYAWGVEMKGLGENDVDVLIRFNETIDQLIVTSISSFSKQKEQETKLIETMLQASIDPAAILKTDGKFLFINGAMADLINAKSTDVIGKTPNELGFRFAIELQEDIAKTVSIGQPQRRELIYSLPSGRELFFDCQLVPIFDNYHRVDAIVISARDITELKHSRYQDWRNANFDFLTGLPNRRLFIDRLEQTILEAKRKDSTFAVIFIDLDLFKQANDHLGHLGGDQLLVQVAERIANNVRAMDTLARLGGDEFTLIMKEANEKDAMEASKALLKSLEQEYEVGTDKVNLSGSIGLTFFPNDGNNVDQLLNNADQAMYVAKERGGHQIQVYMPSMTKAESESKLLRRELSNALSENQLEVYYQPIIDIRTGAIYGAEALLRWNHPDKGLLTPPAFLNGTDNNGLTDEINAFVLNRAVICQQRWSELSGQAFPIHVNESHTTFITHNHINKWLERMRNSGLNESCITMELTPTSLKNLQASGFNTVDNVEMTDSLLNMAIDNFGIEPFSLTSLKNTNLDPIRIDKIKIDRELVKNAGIGGKTDQILKALVAMAHAIDFKVMGIGVETDEQLQFLLQADFDYAQGFLFSRPISQGDFEASLCRESFHDISPLAIN